VPSGIPTTRPDGVVTCAVAGTESGAITVLPVLLTCAPGTRAMYTR
jgi:hypothetical protein